MKRLELLIRSATGLIEKELAVDTSKERPAFFWKGAGGKSGRAWVASVKLPEFGKYFTFNVMATNLNTAKEIAKLVARSKNGKLLYVEA